MKSVSTDTNFTLQENKMEEYILKELQEKYMRATLTKKEVATELGLSLKTIDNMIKDGSILPNPLKIGSSKNSPVRFRLIDIANFIIDAFEDNEKMEYLELLSHKSNMEEQ